MESVPSKVPIDHAKRSAVLPQLKLVVQQLRQEVQIALVPERGHKSHCHLLRGHIASVVLAAIVLFNLVERVLLHHDVSLSALGSHVLHLAYLQGEIDPLVHDLINFSEVASAEFFDCFEVFPFEHGFSFFDLLSNALECLWLLLAGGFVLGPVLTLALGAAVDCLLASRARF